MENKTVNLNVKIDNRLKQEANDILNDLGLNMSVAINMFLTQVVNKQGIPFDIVKGNKQPLLETLENKKTEKGVL